MKILLVGDELFRADGRTDMADLTAGFHNFPNRPKISEKKIKLSIVIIRSPKNYCDVRICILLKAVRKIKRCTLCLHHENDNSFIEGFGIAININLVTWSWRVLKVLVIFINSTTHQYENQRANWEDVVQADTLQILGI